ncbi:clpX [Symbiodinium sp. CCMP2592]|nr:clpX [Symbiodinium sp. CCMP2592]
MLRSVLFAVVAAPDLISGKAETWTLAAGGLEFELQASQGALQQGTVTWKPRSGAASNAGKWQCNRLRLEPLFDIEVHLPERPLTEITGVNSSQCIMREPPVVEFSRLSVQLDCPLDLQVAWSVTVQSAKSRAEDDGLAAFLRVSAKLAADRAFPAKLVLLAVSTRNTASCGHTLSTGAVPGSPILLDKQFFAAVEHPLAAHDLNKTPNSDLTGSVNHLASMDWKTQSLDYGAVIGAFAEESQARRSFNLYLSEARPQSWQGPLVHYNSWYDFTSWQDQSFFDPRRATTVQQSLWLRQLLAELSQDQMNETSALEKISTFHDELVAKRGVQIDSFLWDDGWDDPQRGMWAFNVARFPNGFDNLVRAADSRNCSNGIWLSPWGGYGQAKDLRVAEAKRTGLEVNEHGLSLAGPLYRAMLCCTCAFGGSVTNCMFLVSVLHLLRLQTRRWCRKFTAAAASFRHEAGVNLFKFDGIAGDPSEVPGEIEAMLSFSHALREVEPKSHGARQRSAAAKDRIWINLTTGTWPSPFFLLWVDSIWRGHRDVLAFSEDERPGLTIRQRWQLFRECIISAAIVQRARFFPISRLMIHGAVLSKHGDARALGLHLANELDWAQEVWSHASLGLLLQELYVSPDLMDPGRWDVLAEALQWARTNSLTLEDTHWAIFRACEVQPYGWAAWRDGLGFLTLRNPSTKKSAKPKTKTEAFTLRDAFELPSGDMGHLRFRIVKRLASSSSKWRCSSFQGAKRQQGECVIASNMQTYVELDDAELVILEFRRASSHPNLVAVGDRSEL